MEDIKKFRDGGMNLDDAPQDLQPNEYLEAYNFKLSGVSNSEEGDGTNIESNELIAYTLPDGINKTIGSASFTSIRKIIDWTYNSNGFHSINEFDYDTNIRSKLFVNKTDSDGVDVMPLDPEVYVKDIKLIDDTYIAFLPSNREPSIFNLERLRSGGYGVVKSTDFSLIKAQPSVPINPVYGDDAGVSSNLVTGRLIQFRYQYIYVDDFPSAWSVISRRAVPDGVQSTQTDVTKDNNIRVNINVGDDRVKEIRVAALINDSVVWQEIRNVKRSEAIAITDTAIDINNNIREAYDPATNEYIFVFYNNNSYQPIDVLETDLDHDYVPLTSEALELANGNVILLGNNKSDYNLPEIDIDINVGYQSSGIENTNTDADALKFTRWTTYTTATWSVFGGNKGVYNTIFTGIAKQGDRITIRTIKRGGSGRGQILTFEYLVSATADGNTLTALNEFGALQFPLGFNVFYQATTDEYILRFVANYQFEYLDTNVQVAAVESAEFNSVRSIKLNSSYEGIIIYRDKFGRPFPPAKTKPVTTLHYGATKGLIPVINWKINNIPPVGATTYQFGLSYNLTHLRWLYVNAKLVTDRGSWNASTNSPTLPAVDRQIGDFYQVSVAGDKDLGNGNVQYNLGDYVIYNGLTYDRILYSSVQESTGKLLNIGNSTNFITLYIGSLNRFNKTNSTSIINYDFSVGDRCTIHYYKPTDDSTVYFENPAIDVEVVAYDASLNILRLRKPINFDTDDYVGFELLIEIYTPKQVSTESEDNVLFEIGDVYKITNGEHEVTEGTISEADSFIKTREYLNANDYTEPDVFLVEDANYSDFTISNFYSYGRPHIYNSLAKQNINKADVRYSDVINKNNGINMLNRFYAERVETYDYTKGGIKFLIQRGNIVVCIQELEYCYIPIEQNIIEAQDGQLNVAISDKLLNKARYPENNQAGIGNAVESLAYYKGNIYFVDPFRSEPCRIGYNGLTYLSGKLSKFFKRTIQENYKQGLKYIGWINVFDENYLLSVENRGDIVKEITFNLANWITEDTYPLPQVYVVDSTILGTADITGNQLTFTPEEDEIGEGGVVVSFDDTKKVCIDILEADALPEEFFFLDLVDQPVSSVIESNAVLISGINIGVPILAITGGEYQINDGAWSSTLGTLVYNNDSIRLRQTSSASNETQTDVNININGQTDIWSVTTQSDIITVTAYGSAEEDPGNTSNLILSVSVDFSLSVDVLFEISYSENGLNQPNQIVLLPTGQTFASQTYGKNNPTATITFNAIISANPNPAAGVTIIF